MPTGYYCGYNSNNLKYIVSFSTNALHLEAKGGKT